LKAEDVPFLEQKVLDMLPVIQAEVWKTLEIGRRDCSALVALMLDKNLIRRTRSNKTFLLERKNGGGKKEPDYSPLLSKDGKFSPCCGCGVCEPYHCDLLIKWLN